MNASPDIASDSDQLLAEYERLKPLRDLENLLRKERSSGRMNLSFGRLSLFNAVISTGAAVWIACSFLRDRPTAPFGAWHIVLASALGIFIAMSWVEYVQSINRARLALIVTLLRTLTQDINELRLEKK